MNNENEINAQNGVQVIIANDNATVNATQNNNIMHKDELNSISLKNNKSTIRTYWDKIKGGFSKKVILRIFFVISIVFFFSIIIKKDLNAYSIYKNYMDEAAYLKQNQSYLKAANNYYNALMKAKELTFNQDLYIKAACREADCYLLQALEENDDNIARQYYAKAGGKYGKIISEEKNKKSEFYIDSLTGLSYVYNLTQHKIDEEWKKIIDLIEKESLKMKNVDESVEDNYKDEDLAIRWLKIYSSLGDFYFSAIKADYSYMHNPLIPYKALLYYEKEDTVLALLQENNLEVALLINPIHHAKIQAELMIFIASSSYVENSNQYAEKAIDLCRSYLDNASINIEEDVESYISFKALMADGYNALGKYYCKKGDNKKSKDYKKKAYDELRAVLYMKSDKIQLEQIIDVGYSAIFTEFCSDEDLEQIMDNYQVLISKYNINEHPKEFARLSFNICDGCLGIINIYGYSKRVWKIGKEISDKVKGIEEFVQKSQKNYFDYYYDYFHQDIDHIKDLTKDKNI